MGSDNKPNGKGERAPPGSGRLGPVASLFKWVGVFVIVLAIAFGTVAKVRPSLFFKIPRVGHIFWELSGGDMPPYFSTDPYEGDNHLRWLKDRDVVISTGTKSGTTWMLFCTHQIRIKGQDGPQPFVDLSYTTPWPEMMQHPDRYSAMQQMDMMLNVTLKDGSNLNDYWNNAAYPFRIFKSHFSPRRSQDDPNQSSYGVLPVRERPNVKYVAMVRNGLEVVRSWNSFVNKHRDELRNLWGGFPARVLEDNPEEVIQDWLPGGIQGRAWFEYVAGWWKVRHDPNVLLLHYSDMTANPRPGIVKLAAFVGVDLTPTEMDDVERKCSKEYMSARPEFFRYLQPLNPTFGNGEEGWVNLGAMEVWAQTEREYFQDQDDLVEWARAGGTFS